MKPEERDELLLQLKVAVIGGRLNGSDTTDGLVHRMKLLERAVFGLGLLLLAQLGINVDAVSWLKGLF